MTEFHWRLQLRQLCDMVKKVRVSAAGKVHVVEDIHLPGFVRGVLGLGPKFAVQPQMKKPELLSMVRQVSKRAPEHEATRIISEGVDALNHSAKLLKPAIICASVSRKTSPTVAVATSDATAAERNGIAVPRNRDVVKQKNA
ncbi:hypothetical protein HPB50_014973 [Hyalomma asiaticum]|uniref:Uncharacterized protein n=1 Tax=Hyalomma asiaticum TaxID=266040 RepID=A0ACB7RMA9_HYAAI|nr:hypothetical protein HPB50_014973 [Hyalomma asiaticum]